MTAVGLIRALAREVGLAVETYSFEGDNQPLKKVSIYAQNIPKAHLNDPSGHYHPLILVACRSIEDDREGTMIEAGITVGTYGESGVGDGKIIEPWLDLLNILGAIRLRLLKYQLLERRYRLLMPLETEVSEIQPAPFYYGELTARYMVYQPSEERRTTR